MQQHEYMCSSLHAKQTRSSWYSKQCQSGHSRIILSPNVHLCPMEQHAAVDGPNQLLTLFQVTSLELHATTGCLCLQTAITDLLLWTRSRVHRQTTCGVLRQSSTYPAFPKVLGIWIVVGNHSCLAQLLLFLVPATYVPQQSNCLHATITNSS